MKIDSSLISAYATAKPRSIAEDNTSGVTGGAAAARNIPTVGPAGSMPSGLANTLWLANAKIVKAQEQSDSLAAEFMELSKMTPAERLREQMLEEMGLTEDSLKALPKEQRQAAEDEIRRAIKEQLGIDEQQHAGAVEGQPVAGTQEAEA